MSNRSHTITCSLALLLLFTLGAPQPSEAAPRIRYEGSSTVGRFITDSLPKYRAALFNVSTLSESSGGEACLVAKRCDIGGVASEPTGDLKKLGLQKVLIGYDAIAAIVNSENPVSDLSKTQLQQIFSGAVNNWSALGGPDLPITVFATQERSATHRIFRAAILGEKPYGPVKKVSFDSKIITEVANEPGAIGQISTSFLYGKTRIRALTIAGVQPNAAGGGYPITRPLYLLTTNQPEEPVRAFLKWVLSEPGQRVLGQRFAGIR
jgi:phosphate transport system substrate-binding protein